MGPKSKEADLWIKVWATIEKVRDNDIRFGVKAYRIRKDSKEDLFEKFATERSSESPRETTQGEDLRTSQGNSH